MKTCFWTKEEKTVYLSGSHISEVEVMRRDSQCIRTLYSQEYLQNDSLPGTMWKRRYFILPSFSLVDINDSTTGYFQESLYTFFQTSLSSVNENRYTSQSILILASSIMLKCSGHQSVKQGILWYVQAKIILNANVVS